MIQIALHNSYIIYKQNLGVSSDEKPMDEEKFRIAVALNVADFEMGILPKNQIGFRPCIDRRSDWNYNVCDVCKDKDPTAGKTRDFCTVCKKSFHFKCFRGHSCLSNIIK